MASNILLECKKLGIEADVSPVKLKQGIGEAVVTILSLLLDLTMRKQRVVMRKPNFRSEAQDDEGENEEMEEDEKNLLMETNVDEDEGLEEVIESPGKEDNDEDLNAVIESTIDPHEWKIECERVAPLLKVKDDNKEKGWRTQMDSIQK